jgi:hypothetical protein
MILEDCVKERERKEEETKRDKKTQRQRQRQKRERERDSFCMILCLYIKSCPFSIIVIFHRLASHTKQLISP